MMLPVKFYNQDHMLHSQWSLDTFHHWLSVIHPHVHAITGTVYGGPHSVKQIVFAFSQISSAIEIAKDKSKLPGDACRARVNWPWDRAKTQRQLSLCVMELRRQVARLSSILQLSFNERAHVWKAEIEQQYYGRKDSGTLRPRPLNEPGLNMSSGVPTASKALEAIWKAIRPKWSKPVEEDESLEASRVYPIVPLSTRRILHDPDLDSVEQINMRRDSELSGSSSKHSIRSETWPSFSVS